MKKFLRNGSLIAYYIVQFLILGLCFLAFTSTIQYLPWYEPLTMGAFIAVMILTPIQASISFAIGSFRKKLSINKDIYTISRFNTGILIFAIIITIIKESLFYLFSKVFGVIECLLIIYFLITIIRSFIRIKK